MAVDLELNGKIAVVTGASVGLGREIARVLAAEGTQTVVVARRANLLTTLQNEIERAGGARPLALPLDLYAPDAATHLIAFLRGPVAAGVIVAQGMELPPL